MQGARVLALILVAASVLAGCTVPAAPVEAEAPTIASPTSLVPLALARPSVPARAALPADIEVSIPWLKPFRTFEASVLAPRDATVAWFVEHEEVDARATVVDGDVFVLKATTPDHHNTQGPRGHADVPDLQPDGRARALRIEIPGRYTLAAGDARLVLNVWPGAPREEATQAFLVDDEGALRFEPAELDGALGSRFLLWNQAGSAVDVNEVGYAAHVPLAAQGGEVTPIDEGLYHLTALVRDATGARGVAREGFLVDFERPSERLDVGPIRGEFLHPETQAEPTVRRAFTAHFPLRTFSVSILAGSPMPTPASVQVSLWREGELVAQASSLTARSIELVDIPAGDYALEVRGEHGALVSFDIAGDGVYRLPIPERLRQSTA